MFKRYIDGDIILKLYRVHSTFAEEGDDDERCYCITLFYEATLKGGFMSDNSDRTFTLERPFVFNVTDYSKIERELEILEKEGLPVVRR